MAGIYIHIPFCRKACHYCDFHFSTNLSMMQNLVDAIILEIEKEKQYLSNAEIETIYFGGGTPSLLPQQSLFQILNAVAKNFKIANYPEITLEINPDDVSKKKLKELKQSGINRLSLGVQSFKNQHLKMMNRAHNSYQAIQSILMAQDLGFSKLNIDLIYGFNELTEKEWLNNLETFIQLNIPHLSAYALTIEEKTVFGVKAKKGEFKLPNENKQAEHFEILTSLLEKNNFEHYEISNFCKPGKESKHNTSYWYGKHYLGIGPSAHSFNGISRKWNVRNNAIYIKNMHNNLAVSEEEVLTEINKINEFIMVRLRTNRGILFEEFEKLFGHQAMTQLNKNLKNIESLLIDNQKNRLILTKKGKLYADKIASDLFF
jgi:oxygen-independent coproporphyrinogen-3 oxidase